MKPLTLLLVAVAALAVSCHTSPRPASTNEASCCATNLETRAVFTDKSLYQLESVWTNDTGAAVKLGQLQGRVQVVAMFFASCTYACPILVQDVRRIEAALPQEARQNTGFTLVTIDPERDTPNALQAYRATHKFSERWTLLHGQSDDTLELAALLGVKYKREASGQFAHSNLITVLNGEGEIIYQLAGLNQDCGETVRRITALAVRRTQP